jgi:hypothetical protein
MDDACGGLIPWRHLELDRTLEDRVREARDNQETILVITDLATLHHQLYKRVVESVDRAAGERSAILVIRNEAGPAPAAAEEQVEFTLGQVHFPNAFAKAWYRDCSSIRSVDDLCKVLGATVVKLRTRLINEGPPRPAHDPAIVDAAIAAGVPVERQPVLAGPGGKGP